MVFGKSRIKLAWKVINIVIIYNYLMNEEIKSEEYNTNTGDDNNENGY